MDTVHTVARILLGLLFIFTAVLGVVMHGRPAKRKTLIDSRPALIAVAVEVVLVALAIDWSC